MRALVFRGAARLPHIVADRQARWLRVHPHGVAPDPGYASAVDAWAVWLIVAVALAIAEILSLTFVLGMLSGGAVAAAVIAALGAPLVAQLIGFGAVSALLLALVLPIVRRHRRTPAAIRTGTARLIGTRAMALSDINTATGGRVRIGGETWTARPYDEGLLIPAGEWVDVLAIDGVTAVVHPTTLPGTGISTTLPGTGT
jgi:membrane protein implicated in regulation of membrane protease activity